MPEEGSTVIRRRTERGRAGAGRLLGLFDLFTVDRPVWTVDEMATTTGTAVATIYRDVRALAEHGLLVQAARGGYQLGPRIIELDRQMRIADPLLRVAPAIMAGLRGEVAGAQLLCSFYGEQVLCVYQDQSDPRIRMSMERGRPFPLFRGAPSRIILANLTPYRQRKLYQRHHETVAAAGLGQSWPVVGARLRQIRRTGYYVGSEIDPELVGVAAPVFRAADAVIGSLCVVRLRAEVNSNVLDDLIGLARRGATEITAALQRPPTPVAAG